MDNHVNVLDKGYVRLIDSMGTDLSVVNAARASYDKESVEFGERDANLLAFLVRENHTAPFRHGIIQLECYAPLMVKNQWFKHLIGGIHHNDQEFPGIDPFFGWNESSRRYVTEKEEFYVPSSWRAKPANSKQGSGGAIEDEEFTEILDTAYLRHINEGLRYYRDAMHNGVAPEQARLFLPAYALYVRWRWTTSLQGVMHFINLRDESHAQEEIQEYARAVKKLAATKFPVSIGE
jgi:thymidylate synthase (FAD)